MRSLQLPSHAIEALSAARARLRDACTAGPIPAPEPKLLDEEIGRVAEAVEARLVGAPPPDLPAAEADRVAILDALRARALEAWPEGETEGLLATMRALEAVRADLSPGDAGPLPPGILSPYGHRLLREVAHTLRSPLGSMVMLTATLRDADEGKLDPLQRKHIGLVYRATTTLVTMSNDLLALTGESMEASPEPVSFSLGDVVGAIEGAIAPIAAERGVAFHVQAAGIGRRLGRPRLITRALTNLVLNAALMLREGRLSFVVSPDGDEVDFVVEATAADEPAEEVMAVFSAPPGARGYTLSHRGLGLALARHLLRRMGSDLRVEAGTEGGLTFSFRLDLPPAEE